MVNDGIDVIVGAGPAGLTAAYELLEAGHAPPIVIESGLQVGGISKTIEYRGNRMDLGGHRFFSKSDWVMNWWQKMLPVESTSANVTLGYQNDSRELRVSSELFRGAGSADARAPAAVAHLLRAQLLRLPDQAQRQHRAQPGARAHAAHRRELRRRPAGAARSGDLARGLRRQPLRRGAVSHLLPRLHGKGLGRAVRGDLRRVGRAADQGALDLQGACARAGTCAEATRGAAAAWRRASSSNSSIRASVPGSSGRRSRSASSRGGAQVRLGQEVVKVHHDGRRVTRVEVHGRAHARADDAAGASPPVDHAGEASRRGIRAVGTRQRGGGGARDSVPRLHHGRHAGRSHDAARAHPARRAATACRRTTGSTCRNRT